MRHVLHTEVAASHRAPIDQRAEEWGLLQRMKLSVLTGPPHLPKGTSVCVESGHDCAASPSHHAPPPHPCQHQKLRSLQDHHTLLTGPPHPPYRTTTPSLQDHHTLPVTQRVRYEPGLSDTQSVSLIECGVSRVSRGSIRESPPRPRAQHHARNPTCQFVLDTAKSAESLKGQYILPLTAAHISVRVDVCSAYALDAFRGALVFRCTMAISHNAQTA